MNETAPMKTNGRPNNTDPATPNTGARDYPVPPFPAQHIDKPGLESDLVPAPMFEGPFYKGSEKLKDKVAIITGGDSGIGRSVAVLFAREGADIAILYLNEDKDALTTKAMVEAEGRKCLLVSGDITHKETCAHLVHKTLTAFGQIDILVNNAAYQEHANALEDLSEAQFEKTIRTNLLGMFYMVQASLPHLRTGGVIINTGSVTGINGHKDLADYALTKGGIHAFTKSLAAHLLPRGIRVNAVAPGPVWTPLNPADKSAKDIVNFGKNTPMGRPAQPEEIAPAYVFLASSHCSSYITGEIIPVIGGYK